MRLTSGGSGLWLGAVYKLRNSKGGGSVENFKKLREITGGGGGGVRRKLGNDKSPLETYL